MKKLIITESQYDELKRLIEIKKLDLPSFIITSIDNDLTPLSNNPSLPTKENHFFENILLKTRLYDLISNLKTIDDLNGDYSNKNLISKLEEYITSVRKIEKNNKEKLEKLCFDYVNENIKINEFDDLQIYCEISNSFEKKQPITPKNIIEIVFGDITHFESIKKEILKRRMINALIQGACVNLSTNINIGGLSEIDESLPGLYNKINIINEYLSFIKEQTPTKENIAGAVYVYTKTPKIESYGLIFPTLLFETIKGLFEMISSEGLPEDEKMAQYIIDQSDYLLAESWDKRFGVGLWNIMLELSNNSIDNAIDVFKAIVKLPTKEFNESLKEIFNETEKGKEIVSEIINNLQEATALGNVGSIQYDMPAFGDKETMDHKNMIQKSINDGLRKY